MTYIKQTHNSSVCSEKCRLVKDNRRKALNQRRYRDSLCRHQDSLPGDKVSTCEVCGKQFVGPDRYKVYKCCEDAGCRAVMRRLAGLKAAKTVRSKKELFVIPCNVCGKEWETSCRFIRTCLSCKANQRLHETYCDAWGAVI